ncbi:hypothetical protein H0H81_007503 [Sphagnurus paluster]|uniref:GRIP domain-containing protein n=1 Tax=Sphagnurus paluster TaxID=117069 RepID=A0A9P7KLD8_9AGAR|nr:hypothetical protein H0H81_007503 [Sphagnurus paluster]
MFSQFRQAVENLAAPLNNLDGVPGETRGRESLSRSTSLDSPMNPSSPMTSSQLAESALSNLRKSLATQRSGSVGSVSQRSSSAAPRTKSTLEDRLRAATFNAIGEVSHTTTTELPRAASPSLTSPVHSHPLSPPLSNLADPTSLPQVTADAARSDTGNKLLSEKALESRQQEQVSVSSSELEVETPQPPSEKATETNHHTETGTPPPIPDDAPNDLSANKDNSDPQMTSTVSGPSVESPDSTAEGTLSRDPSEATLFTASGDVSIPESTTTAEELKMASSGDLSVDSDTKTHPTPLEELQERLKQVEQRFTDVSTSFKRLQAEKQAADLVLQELTPLESLKDSAALREYLQSLKSKTEDERIEGLQDTHRLEVSSQSSQIEKLQIQVVEAEALLRASQNADVQAEELAATKKAEMEQLHKDLDRARLSAKEEEEKRVKAISLLKTVRQKLVKAEREKDEAIKEAALLQEKERGDRERDQMEKTRLRNDLESANAERENAITGLRAQFEREVATLKERFEKDLSATRGQFELDSNSIKNTHAHEISLKDSHIRSLEQSLSSVTRDKNSFFDDLQLRQAELESAQSHLESLQSQNTEYQYQLRELEDRYALLKEDLAEARREQENRSREPTTSPDEVARLLSAAEAKYEARISDLKRNLSSLEKERNDTEADWSRKLREKTREVDDLKRLMGSATRTEQHHEQIVAGLKAEMTRMEGESRLLQEQLQEARQSNTKARELEKSWKAQETESNTRITALQQQVEETKQREAQLRLGNKTLREELRKVQSSAALLERQRNPGVGYWTSRSTDINPVSSQASISSPSPDKTSRVNSPEPDTRDKSTNDEEVNLEYLRNVILQFLEHKEMRWLELCKLLVSKQSPTQSADDFEVDLSSQFPKNFGRLNSHAASHPDSVLVLYRSYPGDTDLQEYLKHAIQDGSLSIATFVATLLQAARSPELHTAATLDTLCRVALDAHYSSGLPPIGSVVPYDESPITILGIVQDALALLRTAHSLPSSHFHQLTISASELVILLLSCVSDISQVSTAQAMVHFADANELLQTFRLSQDVRQVLETFVISLSILIGDDAKAAREAQMMHSIQLALGKGGIHGPSSDTDIVTFSLFLHHLVSKMEDSYLLYS